MREFDITIVTRVRVQTSGFDEAFKKGRQVAERIKYEPDPSIVFNVLNVTEILNEQA